MNNKLFLVSCSMIVIFIFISTNVVSLSIAPTIHCYIEGEINNVTFEESSPGSDVSLPAPDRYILNVDVTTVENSEKYNRSNINETEACPDLFSEGENTRISIPDVDRRYGNIPYVGEIDEYELTAGNRINGTVKTIQRFYFKEYDVEGEESAPVDKPNMIFRWFINIYQTIAVLFA